MIVGVLKEDQNWGRNITRHAYPDVQIQYVQAPYRFAARVARRFGRQSEFLENTHVPPVYPRVDLLHVWRTVCFGKQPWVVSTSVGLPFGWRRDRYLRAMELLASPACRRIIVNSRYARDWQLRKATRFPNLADEVMAKVEVLHTPQDALVKGWDAKVLPEDDIVLTIVGNQFFRKGGMELLRVVDRLICAGAPLRLNIVSQLKCDSHSAATTEDVEMARSIIDRHKNRIMLYANVPNPEVLEMFRRSHLGVLVSYVETYGYSVLEAQAAGCPVVTTNVFAFPELNPDDVGWQIDITDGGYDYATNAGRARISQQIETGLERTLRSVLDCPGMIRAKGERALARIHEVHSPAKHAARLHSIYKAALNSDTGGRDDRFSRV